MQPYRGVASGDDGGNAVLASHREAWAARVPLSVMTAAARTEASMPERWLSRQAHRRRGTRRSLAGLHDAYRSGSAACRCGVPDDDVLGDLSLATGFLHGAADHIPISRTGCPRVKGAARLPLALPQVAPLIHEVNDRLTSHNPKGAGDFFVVAEEHIIGLFDRTGRDHVFAEPAHRPAGWATRGEVAGLFLSDDRIPLIDLQQLVELGE